MEIVLTLEQECQLSALAAVEGKAADVLALEMLLHELDAKASQVASRDKCNERREAASRLLILRKGNLLPDGVTILDLMREGRD